MCGMSDTWLGKQIAGHDNPGAPASGSRSLDTAFQPSTTKWTLLSFTIEHSLADGNDGSVELRSDSANPPTTKRASSRGTLAATGGTAVVRNTMTYLVPPGDYVKLVKAGTGTIAIDSQWESALT